MQNLAGPSADKSLPPFIVYEIPYASDNRAYAIVAEGSDAACVIDAGNAKQIDAALEARGLHCGLLLLTHRHHDHIAGAKALKKRWGCRIVGPAEIPARICDDVLEGEESICFGALRFRAIQTPGHTRGHTVYHLEQAGASALFSGDLLFLCGCGRVFEGTAAQMWQSLQRVRELSDTTVVYPGHDYLEDNLAFAKSLEPDNVELTIEADAKRLQTLTVQKRINPFLRADDTKLRDALGLESSCSNAECFALVRKRKNRWG